MTDSKKVTETAARTRRRGGDIRTVTLRAFDGKVVELDIALRGSVLSLDANDRNFVLALLETVDQWEDARHSRLGLAMLDAEEAR